MAGNSSLPQDKKKKRSPLFLQGKMLLSVAMITAGGFYSPSPAKAEDKKSAFELNPPVPRHNSPSTNQIGVLGLNTIPSARMDDVGTVRIGTSVKDPYAHGFIGFQLAKPLYVSFSQTAETSGYFKNPDALYPGLDLKLRLLEETATRPAIALGFDSALGVKRLASEYLTLSKRVNNFDLTAGMAWGRLGSAGHIKNPLRLLSSHFDKDRGYGATAPHNMDNWFTGKDIGFFGGVEYYTPLNGLSLKADYGANDYVGEADIAGFNAPAPWSIGLNYKPWEQIDLSAGIIGGNTFMARLSLQDQLQDWPGKSSGSEKASDLLSPRPQNIEQKKKNFSFLSLFSSEPTGRQIGQKARDIANNSPFELESLEIKTSHKGLTGPKINIIRHDLEEAVIKNHGSPEEIWQDATIDTNHHSLKNFFQTNHNLTHEFRFILENKLSLSEQDAGTLYRSSFLVEAEKELPLGMIVGASGRLNLTNNLDRLRKYRFIIPLGVRSNEVDFAEKRLNIDRLYIAWLRSLTNSTHIALTGGYLEEMYTGLGGEILYRPYGKTFSAGAEIWRAYKRDPSSAFSRDYFDLPVTTGHLNLSYEVPNSDITAFAKIGQYLLTDRGATLGLKTRFDNGATLEGSVTTTDLPIRDFNGDQTHVFWGVRLALPLGNIPLVPNGSAIRFNTGPMSRDTGQILDTPLPLYDVTEPISSRQMNRSWKTLLD